MVSSLTELLKKLQKGNILKAPREGKSLELGKLNDTGKVRVLQGILRILRFNPKNMGSHRITLKNSDIIKSVFKLSFQCRHKD